MTSSLSPSDWPALSALLDQALALPAADRARWIESLDNEHVRHKETLRRLLARVDVETNAFLQTLPRLDDAGALQSTLEAGQLVGPYRLLRQIGAGGMGAVWLAERADGSLKRKVALKLPRLAWGGGLAERLERERDILASLEHPHIARLYDAGVDQQGWPYLALEYVEGQPIDEYCDHRKLTVRERIDLILQVSSAVAFAHSRLVVHRDLKPSNILVTADGQVRLLDFGIAKLLAADGEEEAALTAALGQGLTLNYASPEQVQGRQLTTATDQYSLAVVAYELLCGVRPFAAKGATGLVLARHISESDVPPPSHQQRANKVASARATTPAALRRELARDIDAVLCRALSRTPTDRYPSIDAFAEDLRRWHNGEPVAAKPRRTAYLIARFVQRHLIVVTLGLSASLAIIIASTLAITFAFQAQQQIRSAQQTKDFLINLLKRADPYKNEGRELSMRELLRLGQQQAAAIEDQPQLQAEVFHALASLALNFGEMQIAADAQKRVSAYLRSSGTPTRLAESLVSEAEVFGRGEEWPVVASLLAEAESVLEPARWTPKLKARADVLRGWISLVVEGQSDIAKTQFESAQTIAVSERDAHLEALAIWGHSEAMGSTADPAERVALLKRSMRLLEEGLHEDTYSRILVLQTLSETLYDAGRYVEGFAAAEKLVSDVARLAQDPSSQLRQRLTWMRLCLAVDNTSKCADWLRRFDLTQALETYGDPTRGQWYAVTARVWAAAAEPTRALEAIERGRLVARNSAVPRIAQRLSEVMAINEALVHLRLGNAESALRSIRLFNHDEVSGSGPKAYRDWIEGVALVAVGDLPRALLQLESARALFPAARNHPRVALIRLDIALLKLRLGAVSNATDLGDLVELLFGTTSILRDAYGQDAVATRVAGTLEHELRGAHATVASESARRVLAAAKAYHGLQLFCL